MASLSFAELQQFLQSAGLDSASSAIGAAIALAESGGRTDAVNYNPPTEISVGPWQINLLAHPDVTQACAMDAACAAAAVARISRGGLDWTAWSTFTSGAYKTFLGARQAVQNLVNWVVTLRFGQRGPSGEIENGTDVAVAQGTDFVSPFSGTVTLLEDKGKQDWGKRVLITIDQGPLAGLQFGAGHLTDFAVALGQRVDAGQLLGHTGGDPADPSSGESTGQHVEVQVRNAAGKFLDPEQVLAPLGIGIGALFAPHGATSLNPLSGPTQAIADALTRIGYLLLGLAFVFVGIVLLVVGSIPWGKAARLVAATTPEGAIASSVTGAAK